ncbi:MAG: hypothetical protein JSR33_07290 [Proteobacteria bacterium]|nr:hypothetical protein [Pseudomonadota bacterium]
MSKTIVKNNELEKLPTALLELIFLFLSGNEKILLMTTNHYFESSLKETLTRHIEKDFSHLLRKDELKGCSVQELKTVYWIFYLHFHFSRHIQIFKMQCYAPLIEKSINDFLNATHNTLEQCAWAAYILGDVQRLKNKTKAARYFMKAACSTPPLAQAKLMLLIYFSNHLEKLDLANDCFDEFKGKPDIVADFFRKDYFFEHFSIDF